MVELMNGWSKNVNSDRTLITKCYGYYLAFPVLVHFIVILLLGLALLGIIYSLALAVAEYRKEWKPMPDGKLMYSYFFGTGNLQRKNIYKKAKQLLFDWKWLRISVAWVAYFIGNISCSSNIVLFLISIIYLPLMILGTVEMTFRVLLGSILYFLLNALFILFYISGRGIIFLCAPVLRMLDGALRMEQHCPICYDTFPLPDFICPSCGEIHQKLLPVKATGILFARCSCGRFLPSSIITGRNSLDAVCPNRGHFLANPNARHFSVQIIGGNSSGKSAFVAAFQHICLLKLEGDMFGDPKEAFDEVEAMFTNGQTAPSSISEIVTYNFVHHVRRSGAESLVFYDIPDEVLLSEEYEREPRGFGYSDGIIVMIDPLAVPEVRKECEQLDSASIENYSEDNPESIIAHFINKFSEVSGCSAKKMSDIPVAVLITKCDIKGIKRRVGRSKIKSLFISRPERYGNNLNNATNLVCREYLIDIGLGNVLNKLDSVFTTVRCFPVSAIGHNAGEGSQFEPYGVIEPVAWMAQSGSKIFAEKLRIIQRYLREID